MRGRDGEAHLIHSPARLLVFSTPAARQRTRRKLDSTIVTLITSMRPFGRDETAVQRVLAALVSAQ
jgi:hypothetical protein